MAMAMSWRVVGTLDTLILSYVIICYLGPVFGFGEELSGSDILETASYIALTEVVTKTVLYFTHERLWARVRWGVSSNRNIGAEACR